MMTNLAFTKMSILPTLPYSRLNFRTVEGVRFEESRDGQRKGISVMS